jgi:hypothetical protein
VGICSLMHSSRARATRTDSEFDAKAIDGSGPPPVSVRGNSSERDWSPDGAPFLSAPKELDRIGRLTSNDPDFLKLSTARQPSRTSRGSGCLHPAGKAGVARWLCGIAAPSQIGLLRPSKPQIWLSSAVESPSSLDFFDDGLWDWSTSANAGMLKVPPHSIVEAGTLV